MIINFNLSDLSNSIGVVNNFGYPVILLNTERKSKKEYFIIGKVKGKGGKEYITEYNEDGICSCGNENLFLVVNSDKVTINIGETYYIEAGGYSGLCCVKDVNNNLILIEYMESLGNFLENITIEIKDISKLLLKSSEDKNKLRKRYENWKNKRITLTKTQIKTFKEFGIEINDEVSLSELFGKLPLTVKDLNLYINRYDEYFSYIDNKGEIKIKVSYKKRNITSSILELLTIIKHEYLL